MITLVALAALVQVPSRLPGSEESAIVQHFYSWALRPDGKAAVYVVGPERGRSRLLYQDLRGDDLPVQLPDKIQADTVPSSLQPRWSPDGRWLAYFLPVNGVWRLHIWALGMRTTHIFEQREACARGNGCSLNLEWSPDSRAVYFVAKPRVAPGGAAEPGVAGPQGGIPPWRRPLFPDPEHAGVTVLQAVRPVESSRAGELKPLGLTTEVVVADVKRGTVRSILRGAKVTTVSISPNGRFLSVMALLGTARTVRQAYDDWFLIPLEEPKRFPFSTDDGTVADPTRRLKPARHAVLDGPTAWSPDSRHVAFGQRGALSTGDLTDFDVETGQIHDLTLDQVISEPGEISDRSDVTVRTVVTPGAKFNDADQLEWSENSDSIYVTRRTHLPTGWRTRLWRVTLTGKAFNLTQGANFDADLPLLTKAGGNELIMPIERPTGEAGFARLSATDHSLSAEVRLSGRVLSEHQGKFVNARDGKTLFVSENTYVPEELFVLNPTDLSLHKLTRLNAHAPGKDQLPERLTASWEGASGRRMFGDLFLFRNALRPPPPLIIEVYPGDLEQNTMATSYLGRHDTFLPPLKNLLRMGYAVFKPRLPVAGGGNTCDEVARNLDRALEAISESHTANVDSAALIGHSFGGWIVNCAIGRTGRFRAAISVSGGADLISSGFSAADTAADWSIGGGQMNIGQSIWKAPSLYWKESALSTVQNISTPLLLIHGKQDGTVPAEQALEMYTALSRLGKEVTLVVYDKADHINVFSQPDYTPRIVAWVRQHLGDP